LKGVIKWEIKNFAMVVEIQVDIGNDIAQIVAVIGVCIVQVKN
jgi:hypothetical protein